MAEKNQTSAETNVSKSPYPHKFDRIPLRDNFISSGVVNNINNFQRATVTVSKGNYEQTADLNVPNPSATISINTGESSLSGTLHFVAASEFTTGTIKFVGKINEKDYEIQITSWSNK